MADNDDKIIDFFKRTSNQEGKIKSKKSLMDTLAFIKLTKDANGNYYSEESIQEYIKKVCYIVTVMRDCPPSVALYKYKVQQDSLYDFLKEIEEKRSDCQLVDVEKYIPEDLA